MNSVEVNELYAWTAKDADGTEGIIMFPSSTGPMPLVMTKRDTATHEGARNAARIAAAARGSTAKLKRFLLAEVVDTIVPPSAN